jgi:DNA repair protein SbcD/Mre11
LRILCTADVHIGRRPSRLPLGLDARPHSCAEAWLRTVECALAEGVDLVAVSGDLVDQANRFYEAVGPLERGIRTLAEAGIVTVMVAGNHDHDVLPFLVDGLGSDAVRLLGRGGRWERMTFEKDGAAIHIDGWSFPRGSHSGNPLAEYSPVAASEPVLGLLHCDLDQTGSLYAPVALPELRRHSRTLWALGHVHVPRLIDMEGGARILYPGSPQAMDPGETGAHGVWLVDVEPAGFRFTRRELSSVRYDTLEIPVAGASTVEEIDRALYDGVAAHLEDVARDPGPLRLLRCRVRLTGRTPLHRVLEARLRELTGELELHRAEVVATIERVEIATAPARDLEAIAAGGGAPAALATLVRQLESGEADAEVEQLLGEALRAATEVARARPYFQLPDGSEPSLGRGGMTTALADAAAVLLDELLAQKEGA